MAIEQMLPMWELNEETLDLIRAIHSRISVKHYHVLLGGSVLHVGQSHHDLDLYFIPENGHEHKALEIYTELCNFFAQDPEDITVGYGNEEKHFTFLVKFYYGGKRRGRRIDVFIQ